MADLDELPDDAVELVTVLDKTLNIEITDEEAEQMPKFRSMQEAVEYFRKRKKGGT